MTSWNLCKISSSMSDVTSNLFWKKFHRFRRRICLLRLPILQRNSCFLTTNFLTVFSQQACPAFSFNFEMKHEDSVNFLCSKNGEISFKRGLEWHLKCLMRQYCKKFGSQINVSLKNEYSIRHILDSKWWNLFQKRSNISHCFSFWFQFPVTWGLGKLRGGGMVSFMLFLSFPDAYTSKCKNITRRRKSMVDSAFESLDFILSKNKIH